MSNNIGRVDYFGSDEIIQKLDRAGADVNKLLADALMKSVEKPYREMQSFIENHRKTPAPNSTADTLTKEIKDDGDKIYLYVGFNLNDSDGKPGLPALFLNYGTPTQGATHFIDNAIENNIDEIKRVQVETLKKALSDLGLK